MKKAVVIVFLLGACYCSLAQETYKTTRGKIHFNASTPLEDIDAVNDQVNAILKAGSGEFAVVMLIRDFKFKRKLMQEHFNENFMDSENYPKAYFRGNFEAFGTDPAPASPQSLTVKGELTIHGVSRGFETTATLDRYEDGISLKAEFIIRPEDHDIEVPKILFNKIAEEVKVDVALEMAAQ